GEPVTVTSQGVSVALADQGPLLDDSVLARPVGLGDERADGSIMTSFVPTDPEDPGEYPVASDPDDIIEQSGRARRRPGTASGWWNGPHQPPSRASRP